MDPNVPKDIIPFNQPCIVGNEMQYISEAIANKKLSGNGQFTQRCHAFFEEKFGFQKCLLTSSCTDALEMSALLLDIKEGDEVVLPSYTFVSTANAFLLRGAKLIFSDSNLEEPNINADKIEELITEKAVELSQLLKIDFPDYKFDDAYFSDLGAVLVHI